MILGITLAILTIFIFLKYLKIKRINKLFEASGVTGPPLMLPLIGNAMQAKRLNVKNFRRFFQYLEQKYGKVYRVWCLNKCLLFVHDVEYAEVILRSPSLIIKPFLYNLVSLWLGDGLIMSSGLKWQQRRKIITPAFHTKILEQFGDVFDKNSNKLVEKLRPSANGLIAIDLFPVASVTTLDILLETTMGVKINAESTEGLAYFKALKSVAEISAERFTKPLQHFDFTFKLLYFKSYRELLKNVEILHKFTEKVIKERREKLMKSFRNESCEKKENEFKEMGIKKRLTLLDILLQSQIDGKQLTNEEIREEVDNFTFGGHDTITCALAFTLYLLSRHPKEQQKVFEEILLSIGPDKSKSVTMRELQDLKYLECAIKEALRLYPPVPVIGRKAEKDYYFGDKVIPSNTTIVLFIDAICRDPSSFPKPNDFMPERFSSYDKEEINQYAFLPFSAGPRNCIGQKYAMLEIKTIIACLLRHYEILPMDPEVQSELRIAMHSLTGAHVGLRPRKF